MSSFICISASCNKHPSFSQGPHVLVEVRDSRAYARIKLCRTMVRSSRHFSTYNVSSIPQILNLFPKSPAEERALHMALLIAILDHL